MTDYLCTAKERLVNSLCSVCFTDYKTHGECCASCYMDLDGNDVKQLKKSMDKKYEEFKILKTDDIEKIDKIQEEFTKLKNYFNTVLLVVAGFGLSQFVSFFSNTC